MYGGCLDTTWVSKIGKRLTELSQIEIFNLRSKSKRVIPVQLRNKQITHQYGL